MTRRCFQLLLPHIWQSFFCWLVYAVCWMVLFGACRNHTAPLPAKALHSTEDDERNERAVRAIDTVQQLVETGDLLLRTGNDFTSEGLRQLNRRNTTYSHCGLAVEEDGKIYVYHALGGEFNPDQKIRRDALQVFANSAENRGIAVYRHHLSAAVRTKLAATVQQLYRAGIMFDMQFDLQSNDRMYCAEYVYKCLLLASDGKIRCNTSHIGDFEFIGVDDLFLHPGCGNVARIIFK